MYRKFFSIDATAGGNSISPVWVVDTYNNPCNIGLECRVSGTVGYTVQFTMVDPRTTDLNTNANVTWLNHQYLVNQTTTSAGNFAFPPSAIRAVVSAGTGQLSFRIVQAGPI